MSNSLSPLQSIPQLIFPLVLSGYGLHLSYHNITRLQQYEKTSEKAAEWSNTAAQRLHKTRTTQTTGTLAMLLSFVTPIAQLLVDRTSPKVLATTAIVNSAILLVTRQHMANFWNDSTQTRIPFVQKFNEAIRGSEKVVEILTTLALSWGVAGLWWGLAGSGIGGGIIPYVLVVGLRTWQMLSGKAFAH